MDRCDPYTVSNLSREFELMRHTCREGMPISCIFDTLKAFGSKITGGIVSVVIWSPKSENEIVGCVQNCSVKTNLAAKVTEEWDFVDIVLSHYLCTRNLKTEKLMMKRQKFDKVFHVFLIVSG